ncbi:MAG TPA: ABC transporter ATP-binding protein [Thermoplasmata archaeon]|nr:ABC transporter ATP-binding protein [Thermoplasmata archaeon]
MTEEALLADDLRKQYAVRGEAPVEALRGVSVRIQRGERVALLGRNGAGKTTFLRIASTLLIPSSGTVRVFGVDAIADPDAVRPMLAVVPQEGKPFFHLTPREQVYSYLRARGFARESATDRAQSALDQMGLGEVADRLSITLSGGQRQRTMVATVIATEAPLMFLDEPTIGMDPFARREVWESLRRLTRRGSTILLTTHYLDEAEHLAQRLYIIERGKVLVEGSGESLKRRAGGTLRVSVVGGASLGPELESFGVLVPDGEALHVITEPERVQELLGLLSRAKLAATVGPVTLEEAFMRVVGRSINDEG